MYPATYATAKASTISPTAVAKSKSSIKADLFYEMAFQKMKSRNDSVQPKPTIALQTSMGNSGKRTENKGNLF